MSDSADGPASEETPAAGTGVLAGLPRRRPQRTSARRAAARTAKRKEQTRPERQETPAKPSRKRAPAFKQVPAPKQAPASKRAPTSKRAVASISKPGREQVPKQGYEAELDASGPVQPPGGGELIVSVAELAGELAKTGVTAGARTLRDLFSRLPG